MPAYYARMFVFVRVGIEEGAPRAVAALVHARNLVGLEGVHAHRAHERHVHAEPAVLTGAAEAQRDAEFRRSLDR